MQDSDFEKDEAERIEDAIHDLLSQRKAGGTICPSEVARRLYPQEEWRSKMTRVREVAFAMVESGRIEITQGGKVVDARNTKGAIRLRRHFPV
ncbi:MAG: DUF3253 domain-containing protein [Verrucomicrobiota bacterium]